METDHSGMITERTVPVHKTLQGHSGETPDGPSHWQEEAERLDEENQVLKRCLRSMRDNSALETANLLAAVVTFTDKKFRKKFADGMEGVFSDPESGREDEEGEEDVVKKKKQKKGECCPDNCPALASKAKIKTERTTSRQNPDQGHHNARYETPERDIPRSPQFGHSRYPPRMDFTDEVAALDGEDARIMFKTAISPSAYSGSSPVSLGGRQLPSDAACPYFYPSEPDSHHMRSHLGTRTPVASDLEYDALYLRSLALAAGYRALARGLSKDERQQLEASPPLELKEWDLSRLCKQVSEIPPYVMFRNRQGRMSKLIHTCVGQQPTQCHPFTREGVRPGAAPMTIKPQKYHPCSGNMNYLTDLRATFSPLNWKVRGPEVRNQPNRRHLPTKLFKQKGLGCATSQSMNFGDTHKKSRRGSRGRGAKQQASTGSVRTRPCAADCVGRSPEALAGKVTPCDCAGRPTSAGQDNNYDFKSVVEPIIDQARASIEQATGMEPPDGELTAYQLQHTHREYTYKDDGTAQVQSDHYKKSFNWSSEEEAEARSGGSPIQVEVQGQSPEPQVEGQSKPDVKGYVRNILEDAQRVVSGDEVAGVRASPSKDMRPDHIRWDPHTQFETHNSQHLIHMTSEPHPRKISTNSAEHLVSKDTGETSGQANLQNKTNNYRNNWNSSTPGNTSSSDEACAVSRDIDWANHCSATSPFRVVTPRAQRVKETPLLLPRPVTLSGPGPAGKVQKPRTSFTDMEYHLPNQPMDSSSDNTPLSSVSSNASRDNARIVPVKRSKIPTMVGLRKTQTSPLLLPKAEVVPLKRRSTTIIQRDVNNQAHKLPSPELFPEAEVVPLKRRSISNIQRDVNNQAHKLPSPLLLPEAKIVPRKKRSTTNIQRDVNNQEHNLSSPLLLPEAEIVPLKKSSSSNILREGLKNQPHHLASPQLLPKAEIVPLKKSKSTNVLREVKHQPHHLPSQQLFPEPEIVPLRKSKSTNVLREVKHQPHHLPSSQLFPEAEIVPLKKSRSTHVMGEMTDRQWVEMYQAHRLASPQLVPDARVVPVKTGNSTTNMLGEVAFQLERRILDYVFANGLPETALDSRMASQNRFLSGYTVSNIGEMINKEAVAGETYSRGTERMRRERLRTLLDILTPMGYDLLDHGVFSQEIINKYGLLARPRSVGLSNASGPYSVFEVGIPGIIVADVQNYIFSAADTDYERDNLLLIFDCLRMLAIEDGRPLFTW
ncbi:uncharacterized protein [Littorina saxatilis]|uniref:uncharacterized protein isoform X2 n=1 Tax=Littorina saxatilis TaxID=31220 RepID=UPI0038B437AF